VRAALAIAAVVLGLGLGGCTLFDDPPDRSCKSDNDCFRAQGETCNPDTHQCEAGPDAAPLEQADEVDLEVECEEAIDE